MILHKIFKIKHNCVEVIQEKGSVSWKELSPLCGWVCASGGG